MNEETQVCPISSMGVDTYNQSGLEECQDTLRNPIGSDSLPKVAQAVRMDMHMGGDVLTPEAQTIRANASASIGGGVALEMVYHENGGNESFEVKGGAMSTIKSESDTTQAHNQLVLTSPTAYIVRRLTPTECERLMGYPDHYTIPTGLQITDALVDEFQDIFANFAAIMEPDKPVKRKSDKQIRAWLEKVANPETCPDAPRYKCCGNGWAINSARWVLQGIDRFLRK